MNSVWYELEIVSTSPMAQTFYPNTIYNRSDENAGFDVYATEEVHVTQTPMMVPFGAVFRLLKVEPMPHGTSNDVLKTESHFWLLPRSSIYKSGLMMANSTGVIDKSYRGELKAPVWSMTGGSVVRPGERLLQIVAPDMGWIRHVRAVDYVPETNRGANGFGSSGR